VGFSRNAASLLPPLPVLRERVGFKFRRQVPVADYVVDFYGMRAGIVVELDGGQHLETERARYDRDRTAKLNEFGIHVIRFTDDEVTR
jgi:very-short-patch-repair endonuclease